MKKLLTTLFLGLLLLPLIASDQDDIKATASIVGEITVIGERDLEFGIISFDNPSTIVYNDVENRSGKFNVAIGPGRPHVLFDFSLPSELTNVSNGGPGLTIDTWTYGYGASPGAPTISGPFPVSNQFEINMATYGRNVDFYIGATVTPTDDNLVGEYEGTITLIVENN